MTTQAMTHSVPPIPLALLICDHIWRDMGTGKFHLQGTFASIGSSVFPAKTSLAVYFAVTDGRGESTVRLELVDVDEDRPAVFGEEMAIVFEGPRQVVEGYFAFENLEIPMPGEYRLRLFMAGEFLISRSLHVCHRIE
jgi:hypothetical protein